MGFVTYPNTSKQFEVKEMEEKFEQLNSSLDDYINSFEVKTTSYQSPERFQIKETDKFPLRGLKRFKIAFYKTSHFNFR